MIDLITLFIVQSILFPLLFLWISILLIKTLFQVDIGKKILLLLLSVLTSLQN